MGKSFIVADNVSSERYCSRLPNFRYEEIKREVVAFLKKCGGQKMPLDVFALARSVGVVLVPYSSLSKSEAESFAEIGLDLDLLDGFLAVVSMGETSKSYIYYSDINRCVGRIRFTIMHELGHSVLGHTQASANAEAEANFFAKYAIAPPVVVNFSSPQDFVEIAQKFLLSDECAIYVFDSYQKWKRFHYASGRVYMDYENELMDIFSQDGEAALA